VGWSAIVIEIVRGRRWLKGRGRSPTRHPRTQDAGRFGASFCQALFVKVCAGAVAVAVAAAPPANDNHNHNHNPILGRTKYVHFLFPNALFPTPGHERRAQAESRICIQPYASSHKHNSRTQLWIEGYRTRLQRLPSSMTCRCCPICALQMHSHRHGICVQHPCLGGFGLSALPPRQPSSASNKCNVTHAS
jgi:hypothetical protein